MERSGARHEVRASTSETAEEDLSALWRELAHETPDARTVMSNLVVFHERSEAEQADLEAPLRDGLVVEVACCHPSRVVLLVHARSDAECRTPLAAAVGILTFGPAEARHAVEQIAVRSQGPERSLPSIVRRLVLGDLPTSVWWTEDLAGGTIGRAGDHGPAVREPTAANGAMCAPGSPCSLVSCSNRTCPISPISIGAGWRHSGRVCREAWLPRREFRQALKGVADAIGRVFASNCSMRQARKRSPA